MQGRKGAGNGSDRVSADRGGESRRLLWPQLLRLLLKKLSVEVIEARVVGGVLRLNMLLELLHYGEQMVMSRGRVRLVLLQEALQIRHLNRKLLQSAVLHRVQFGLKRGRLLAERALPVRLQQCGGVRG